MNGPTKIRTKINFSFNYLIILYAFVMPISVSKSDDFMKILIPLWIISFEYTKILVFIKESRLFQTILLLTFFILLSYLWSTEITTTPTHFYYSDIYDYFYRYFVFFLFPIIMILTKLKKEYISLVITSFVFAMFINEIISYGIFFEFWTTPKGSPENPVPFHKNHITYSTFLGFTILLSIYKFSHIKTNYIRLLLLFFLVTMSINLFMSAGRTGQFSLFITLILLSLIYLRKNIKLIIFSFSILVLVFFIAYNNMTTFHVRVNEAINNVESIVNNKNVDTSFGTRIMAFSTIPYLMNENNILFGVGMGDKASYVSTTLKNDYPYRLENFDIHGFLHNSHLEMLVSNGLAGLLLYFSIFYFLLTIVIKDPFIKYMGYSLGIYLLCFGMVSDIFFYRAIMSIFSLFLGIIILQNQSEKEKEKLNECH
ncbi:MAG: O-antigen ligase family protein [Sulfurimonas sp.]|nr:O-antigen ligase family protein [Sulfurimonas sp.]